MADKTKTVTELPAWRRYLFNRLLLTFLFKLVLLTLLSRLFFGPDQRQDVVAEHIFIALYPEERKND